MFSSGPCINTSTLYSMLASPSPPSFLGPYSLRVSYLGCKALFIVISSLVYWSTYWIPNFVDFKNRPEYLTCGTAQEFIPLDVIADAEFSYEKFSRSSEILLCYFFFHLRFFDGVPYESSLVLELFLFSEGSNSFYPHQNYR